VPWTRSRTHESIEPGFGRLNESHFPSFERVGLLIIPGCPTVSNAFPVRSTQRNWLPRKSPPV
jgi:hypothetical protein